LLAIAVSLDATAVAIARACHGRVTLRGSLQLALAFGLAQALMPAIGAFAGVRLAKTVQAWDHWIAFGVLGLLGVKMIHDAVAPSAPEDEDEDVATTDLVAWPTLLALSLATSIDALAVGVTLPLVSMPVPMAIALIGLVTFVFSFLGSRLGRMLGEKLGTRLGGVGGLMLLGLGTKILLEHLRAGI
jgi:putative Mn2+ efflux pump MntP